MTTPHAPVSPRPNATRDAIAEFFGLQGLPAEAVDALASASRLRRRPRGSHVPGRFASFLVDGCMSEPIHSGKVRLWRELMLFESVSSAAFIPRPASEVMPNYQDGFIGTCLSNCTFIEIPTGKLAVLAMTEPAVGLVIAGMATKRHALTERLYTATRASPVARVAALLDYLAQPTRRNVIRRKDGDMVMTTMEELVASGPSQVDIADALCLGRATVEKAVAELRHGKALRAFDVGERANRCYPIEDRDRLRQIALGG